MAALALIVVPAGLIAALICFRWARLVLICGIIGTVIWMHSAHSQSSPIVQCHIGTWAEDMPDFACDAVTQAVRKLVPRNPRSEFACATAIQRQVQTTNSHAIDICNAVYQGWMIQAERMNR
jgi:hypothetical protein